MIKFWKEDIKYIKRTGWAGLRFSYEYQYHFSVGSESANYLLNKYDLHGAEMQLHYFEDNYITVTSKHPKYSNMSDIAEIDDEDKEELLVILQEDIKEDQRQWEEYKCNDDYPWDTRWN